MRFDGLSSLGARVGRVAPLTLVVLALLGAIPAAAGAAFGPKELDFTFTNRDGSPEPQAGSHPYALTTTFTLNTEPDAALGFEVPQGAIKGLDIGVPPGVVGNLTAVPRCPSADFESQGATAGGDCPAPTVLGTAINTIEEPGNSYTNPVYNLDPPPGVVAEIGFWTLLIPFKVDFIVNPDPPYNVIARPADIPQVVPVYGTKVTLWGVPASPEHDAERGGSVNVQQKPFLTLPTSCTGPLATTFQGESWEGESFEQTIYSHDSSDPPNPLGLTGCDRLAFNPSIGAQPTTKSAQSPAGLEFGLDVKDEGLTSPTGIAQSDIKKVVVALPETMTVNPALAEGLSACSEAELARETVNSEPGEGCPSESKIGTVEVETPLLDKTLQGSLYLATPYQNKFGSLLALYVVVKDPVTGILLKLPGKVEPNQTTGQLVSVFDELPQLPFSHFRLSFRQGQRSPLATPSTCGTYTTQAELTPWANPSSVLHESSTFQITSGVGGGTCPSNGLAPFAPGFTAGTIDNNAGSYSPVDLRITRNDGEQEITGFSTQLPPGLTANLNGVAFCSEAAIAVARGKSGAQEESEPSCPATSQIGHTLVGVGVGSILAYTPGKLYFAGPFEGAPFSVVSITSAKVGPFDLGTVVVHLPLQLDRNTAAVSIPAGASDQIPHIVKGIVVHVRDIRVYVDRPDFTRNPTNCDPLSLTASVIGSGQNFAGSADDVTAAASSRFQLANCANLSFKPDFKASTAGKTSRVDGASLTVKLAFPATAPGTGSNIRSVKVDLPKQLPSRLTTLQKACTEAQFNANPAGCPAASVVGHATALTPILPVPLVGPAYFVSHGGAKFPELIMVLQGYGVTIYLHGETFINQAGVTSSTFRAVPDQPVTSFQLTLPEGRYSALAANGNLCASKLTMPTAFVGQNGATSKQSTPVAVTGCPKAITRKRQLALKACRKLPKGAKRKACERVARKHN